MTFYRFGEFGLTAQQRLHLPLASNARLPGAEPYWDEPVMVPTVNNLPVLVPTVNNHPVVPIGHGPFGPIWPAGTVHPEWPTGGMPGRGRGYGAMGGVATGGAGHGRGAGAHLMSVFPVPRQGSVFAYEDDGPNGAVLVEMGRGGHGRAYGPVWMGQHGDGFNVVGEIDYEWPIENFGYDRSRPFRYYKAFPCLQSPMFSTLSFFPFQHDAARPARRHRCRERARHCAPVRYCLLLFSHELVYVDFDLYNK